MSRQLKAKKIVEILDHYFPDPAIPLIANSHYTLLVAVLLSAQCTDERVNKVTPALFKRADTPELMVTLSVEEIEKIIRPCGLSKNKARYIWELSERLINYYGGQVPDTLEALETLPGIGHKSASVIMCAAFKKSAMPVDTHIHRCAMRWGLTKGKNVVETERDLKKIFPKEKWVTLHLQMIYFARKFCPARGHRIEECPICSSLVGPTK